MKKKNWYKPKGYTHFTPKLSIENVGFVNSYVSNTSNIAGHPFYPLVHRTIFQKRYKVVSKDDNGTVVRKHYQIINEKKVSTVKPREIFYANHLDAHVYSYYAQNILGPIYESLLKADPQLDDAVIGYRRIELQDKSRCKCNIDFANEIFETIKSLKGEYCVLAFDVSKFFDSLNHKKLKQKWCELIGGNDLPNDHYNVYKSLINFHYVEIKDLLKILNYKHPNKLIQNDVSYFSLDGKSFRERILPHITVKENPFRDKSNSKQGIPQGTPISAFLANLYMLDYDKAAVTFLAKHDSIYRRYSDDILVICPLEKESEIRNFILKNIEDFSLIIQDAKTQKTIFKDGKLVRGYQPLKYLGFEFDGKKKRIRSSSLSKYYRNAKKLIKYKAQRARRMQRKFPERAFIYRKTIYKSYSHLGARISNNRKRNYLSYVNLASAVMDDNSIKRQVSRSWDIINNEIERYEKKFNLMKHK